MDKKSSGDRLVIKGVYTPTITEYNEWHIELPEGYDMDDVEDISIRWLNEVQIEFTDGTFHYIKNVSTDHYSTDDNDSDAYKWALMVDWDLEND